MTETMTETPSHLETALVEAARAGRFDVVSQLAKEIEARRLAGSNVAVLAPSSRKAGR